MTVSAGRVPVRIAIFGSCVSRDTCEFMPEADVACYVARQSAIVALNPVGEGRFSSADLDSDFQAKMFEGDQRADGVDRILASSPDLILIDLVDERRGVWRFPDGTFMTNSVEAHRAGMEKIAPARGARLIRFGTDEHFNLWRIAFQMAVQRTQAAGASVVLLDIAWAETMDSYPNRHGPRTVAGAILRQYKRGGRAMLRSLSRGDSFAEAFKKLASPAGTHIEQLAREAKFANRRFQRYARAAREVCGSKTITRNVREVQMAEKHRWGLAQFHYRDEDYRLIVAEIRNELARIMND